MSREPEKHDRPEEYFPPEEQPPEDPETPEASGEPSGDIGGADAQPVGAEFEGAEDVMGALEAERDELYSRLQRVSADYQNSMRRAERRVTDSIELARGDLLKNLIPVLDHFDRAMEAEPTGEEARSLAQGMRIVRDELLKVLGQAGVERIEANVGEPFDPHFHEALMRQPAEGVEPGHIAAAFQAGYAYKGRTLRAAKVAVAPEQ